MRNHKCTKLLNRSRGGEGGMGTRGTGVLISRATRIRTKLESALEASALEIEDVSHQHAGHAAVKDNSGGETHFNVKIVSPKFDGQSLVKRHRMVYDVLSEELQSGLHALSIVANTPKEVEATASDLIWTEGSLLLRPLIPLSDIATQWRVGAVASTILLSSAFLVHQYQRHVAARS